MMICGEPDIQYNCTSLSHTSQSTLPLRSDPWHCACSRVKPSQILPRSGGTSIIEVPMWLRPQTQLSVWLRSSACWLSGVMLALLLDAMDGHLLDLGLPVIATFLLLPLAFIGTWAAADPELPHWSWGRILLYWLVIPGATLSTIVLVIPLAAAVLASQGVALILLTGIWMGRRGGWKALPAAR